MKYFAVNQSAFEDETLSGWDRWVANSWCCLSLFTADRFPRDFGRRPLPVSGLMPPFSQSNQPQNTQQSSASQPNTKMSTNIQYPALSLYPYNDTFIPKHIYLSGKVKIGRQTNAKTVPGERNGYFDSKVLSRQHAEVWEENGKVCERGSAYCLTRLLTATGTNWLHRFISRTWRAPTGPSSMAIVWVQKASSRTQRSSNQMTSSCVPLTIFTLSSKKHDSGIRHWYRRGRQ